MNIVRLKIFFVSALVALSTDGALRGEDWQAANAATVRLKPSAFPDTCWRRLMALGAPRTSQRSGIAIGCPDIEMTRANNRMEPTRQ